MTYAYGERTIWIEPLATEAHPMIHDLCEQHAAATRPPRGWSLRDLRVAPPTLNTPTASTPVSRLDAARSSVA
jgi:hypothetical protein